MNKFKRTPVSASETSTIAITKMCLAFSLVFLIISSVLLLIFSAIFLNFEDPIKLSSYMGKIALYASALLSSFLLSKKIGQSYIFSGILFGALITSIIFLFSLAYPNSTNNSTLWILLVPITTLLGSILGIKRQGKPKRHKRHR